MISDVDESQTFTLVAGDDFIAMRPHWSPDGKSIIFAKDLYPLTGDSEENQFWIVSPDGEQLHQLDLSGIDGDVTWASWGPDSKQLVLSTNNTAKIYVISLDGKQPSYLAEGIGAIWMP